MGVVEGVCKRAVLVQCSPTDQNQYSPITIQITLKTSGLLQRCFKARACLRRLGAKTWGWHAVEQCGFFIGQRSDVAS